MCIHPGFSPHIYINAFYVYVRLSHIRLLFLEVKNDQETTVSSSSSISQQFHLTHIHFAPPHLPLYVSWRSFLVNAYQSTSFF